jgi:antitoxin component HigA of HigAB toxin-antitoxin module
MGFNSIDMGLGALLTFLAQRLKAIWQAPPKVTEHSERIDKAYSALMMTQQNMNHVDQMLTKNLDGNVEFVMRVNAEMDQMNRRLWGLWGRALPDGPARPVEAIKFRMEQQGLTRKDLEALLGSRPRVSEVLNRKRSLSIAMVRRLNAKLGIDAAILVQPTRGMLSRRRKAARGRRPKVAWS